MDKGDIWLPQKIAPIPGKIPRAEADAFNNRGSINTWPQIDHSGHQEGSNIMVSAPWPEGLLKYCRIMREWSAMCRLITEKENKIVKHLEILVTGNVVGDWWYPIPCITTRQ